MGIFVDDRPLLRGELTATVAEVAATDKLSVCGLLPRRRTMSLGPRGRPAEKEPPIEGERPDSVEVVLGNQVYIARAKLPPILVNRITARRSPES